MIDIGIDEILSLPEVKDINSPEDLPAGNGDEAAKMWLSKLVMDFKKKLKAYKERMGDDCIIYWQRYGGVKPHPVVEGMVCEEGLTDAECAALADPYVAICNNAYKSLLITLDGIKSVQRGASKPFTKGVLGYRVIGQKAPWE